MEELRLDLKEFELKLVLTKPATVFLMGHHYAFHNIVCCVVGSEYKFVI